MKCIKCGHEVTLENEKCPKCGTPTTLSEKYHSVQYKKDDYVNHSLSKAIMILIVFIILICLLFYAFDKLIKNNHAKNPNYVTGTIDYSKKSLVESYARHYMDAIEMYVVYGILDKENSGFGAGIYDLKNETDLAKLKQVELKTPEPIAGWFALDKQGIVVAAEFQFQEYKKVVGYTTQDKVNAILEGVSPIPSTVEEAVQLVHNDIVNYK